MGLQIPKNPKYAEASINFVGLTKGIHGTAQYVLVNTPDQSDKLKFPGLRFSAPTNGKTLEDVAVEKFEEQTGMRISKSLGLRAIMPARSRHNQNWIFRNVFVGVVDDNYFGDNDGRDVYLVDSGDGVRNGHGVAYELRNAKNKREIDWLTSEDQIIARKTKNMVNNFDWRNLDTGYLNRIPCIGVPAQNTHEHTEQGCALAVSSILLYYQESPDEEEKVVMLKRKGDDYPGYAGGKIETLNHKGSKNTDPVGCCIEEGEQEFGFPIQPTGLMGVACTAFDHPSESHLNSIINYSFVARPLNIIHVKEAFQNPREYLEEKMENYVVETVREHSDRIRRGELRMPDMLEIGKIFLEGNPADRLPFTNFVDSGII